MLMQRRLCVRGERCEPLTFKGLLNCAVLHHPSLTSDQISREAKIKHGRLLKYASESQPDQIPFDALLRLCAFLNRWDLLDSALSIYGLRTVAMIQRATGHTAIDEAIDVSTCAANILKAVRDLGRNGFDDNELHVIERLCLDMQHELEQLLPSIRARRGVTVGAPVVPMTPAADLRTFGDPAPEPSAELEQKPRERWPR